MGALAGNSLFVDPHSIDDFRTAVQSRLDESFSARLALTTAPAADLPALGRFDDATRTANRLDALRREYVARLDRLIAALTAAETATVTIAQRYRTADDLAAADPVAIALDPGAARRA